MQFEQAKHRYLNDAYFHNAVVGMVSMMSSRVLTKEDLEAAVRLAYVSVGHSEGWESELSGSTPDCIIYDGVRDAHALLRRTLPLLRAAAQGKAEMFQAGRLAEEIEALLGETEDAS